MSRELVNAAKHLFEVDGVLVVTLEDMYTVSAPDQRAKAEAPVGGLKAESWSFADSRMFAR
jgi:hypothetical protein